MTITTVKRAGIYEVKARQGIWACSATSPVKAKAFSKAVQGCYRLVSKS